MELAKIQSAGLWFALYRPRKLITRASTREQAIADMLALISRDRADMRKTNRIPVTCSCSTDRELLSPVQLPIF
jgi:hypothetical protein